MTDATAPPSIPFSKHPSIALQLARTTDDYLGAFTLMHDAGVRAGRLERRPLGLTIAPHQLLESSQVFVAKRAERVLGTLTLVADGALGLPMESRFAHAAARPRELGRRPAEVCCVADRRMNEERSFELFSELSRLAARFALSIGVDELWMACRPPRAELCERLLGYRLMTAEQTPTHAEVPPLVAVRLDLINLRRDSPAEWRRCLGEPIPRRVLAPSPLPAADWAYFHRVADEAAAARGAGHAALC